MYAMSPAVLGDPYSANRRMRSPYCPWRSPNILVGARRRSTVDSARNFSSAKLHSSSISSALRMNPRLGPGSGSHCLGWSSSLSTLRGTVSGFSWSGVSTPRPSGVIEPGSRLPILFTIGVPKAAISGPILLLSDSNWSMDSCLTRLPSPDAGPPSCEPAATTTARWWRRTSELGGGFLAVDPRPRFPPFAVDCGDGVCTDDLPLPWLSGGESMSTFPDLASATAAWASSELSLVIASRLFSGEPSALPGEPWSNLRDPTLLGVPKPPPLAYAFPASPPPPTKLGFAETNAAASSMRPESRSHLCQAGAARSTCSASAAVASARVSPCAPGLSSMTNMSPSRLPPRRPPQTNTKGPTPAVVCRHLRLAVAADDLDPPASSMSATDHPADAPADVFSTESDRWSSTMLPPPSAPPLTCRRVPTKDTACWYLAVGASPGAAAHSHRPSRCRASPNASESGALSAPRPPQRRRRPSARGAAAAYMRAGGMSPAGFILIHSYGLDVVSRHQLSPSGLAPSLPPCTTRKRCATNDMTCAYLCPGPGPLTDTRCHRGVPCRSRTWRSSDARPAGPMPPWTTTMLPTAAALCAARGEGPSPVGSSLVHTPERTSKLWTSEVAPASLMPLVLPLGPSPSSAVAPPKMMSRCPPLSAGTHVRV
mmetsp:Transcript_4238/g.19227  ORF Transcript_4238/g.19227 Transcript_4238/m.19227 type:complete len:654 (-) Transcript_4238:282-2243(-)